jgi:hypothetical protein
MPFNLVLNSNNVVGTNNTRFQYNFAQGGLHLYEGSELCISQIILPYSWFNVNSGYYNNNKFQYTFAGVTYTVTLTDGFYSTQDIFQALELVMISNNQYFINSSTGNYLFYIQLNVNTSSYSNSFYLFPIPTSLPTGYTAPSGGFNVNTNGGTGYPATGNTPQIIFLSTSNFGALLGFKSGTYPSTLTTSNNTQTSNITPNATPVNSIIVRSTLVNNSCATPADIVDTFYPNASFGSQINYSPSYEKWIPINEGVYSIFQIYFTDQNFNPIPANDPNVLISILIKQGKKPIPKQPSINKIQTIEFNSNDISKEDE